MILDLESLDATIVQFDPDFQVEIIKPKAFRPPKDWSNRGQMSRFILTVLRQAAEPLTTRDIAVQLLIERRQSMRRPLRPRLKRLRHWLLRPVLRGFCARLYRQSKSRLNCSALWAFAPFTKIAIARR